MTTRYLMIGLVALMLLLMHGAAAQQPPQAKVRIGTYDSRAIAVAFAASKTMNDELKTMMRQRDEAKKAGDTKKVEELEHRGQEMQRRLHRQGFSGAPVDDILAKVKDQIPKVAADSNVAVIVAKPDYTAADVETVDVTDALVKLFDPSEKTLKTIKDLRSKPIVPVEQVEDAEKKGL
jgi:hypothetical protein